MNFSTDLPKGSPVVTYIVASAVKSDNLVCKESRSKPSFRMHAVVLKDKRKHSLTLEDQALLNEGKGLILCHIRKVSEADEKSSAMKRLHAEASSSNVESSPVNSGPIEKEENKRGVKYCAEKSHNGSFINSKRLMNIIGKHEKGSYAELYVMLIGSIP